MPEHPEQNALEAVARGSHHQPHGVLGPRVTAEGVTVRVLRPLANAVVIRTAEGEYEAEHLVEGIWESHLPGTEVPDYRVHASYGSSHDAIGAGDVTDDPYRFLPTVGDIDLHLISEGRHESLWTVLGANLHEYPSVLGEVTGTSFAVWAPNATAVRVIGDFNHWQGNTHAMRSLGSAGIWEIFVPGVEPGARYKFEIRDKTGTWTQKADPMAKGTEVPPNTASVVAADTHDWDDSAWMTARESRPAPHEQAMSVYEVHLGSWRQGLGYRELARELVDYVKDLNFTHVELMPVAEHPFGGSWGYQVTSYYAPTSRFGSPDDFRFLVDALHQAGIGVILDWVPAHFPKDQWALAQFDGTALYEHADPLRGEQPDWGTLVFDFGRPEVRNFLVANAVYWLKEFHIDGLRVDAVASMLYLDYSREDGQWRPNVDGGRENLEAIAFLQETNATAYRNCPGIVMIAEESTAWPGVTAPTDADGLGFGMKWNMGWMNDTLRYLAEEPVHRSYHHGDITFSLVYAFSEHFTLPLSHDEVVHGKGSLIGKMPGDEWNKAAGVRALLGYQWTHPGKKLLFMGCEFGQHEEWSEGRSLDWWQLEDEKSAGIQKLVRDLNSLYREDASLWQLDSSSDGFEWIDSDDSAHNVLSFTRKDALGKELVVVVNFAGVAHEGYALRVPHSGEWLEVLNTDDISYGGSGVVNVGAQHADDARGGARLQLRVPPLGVIVLRHVKH